MASVLILMLVAAPRPAQATNKEMVELQTQVLQLLDMVQRLQSTMDTRFGVVQHLAEQTADDANRMTAAVSAMQQKLKEQNDAINTKLDTNSGQVQSLNDSVDELKSRIGKLDKAIQDLQTQLQSIQAAAPVVAAPGSTATPGNASAPAPINAPIMTPAQTQTQPAAAPVANNLSTAVPAVSAQAPPLAETFQAGVRDFSAAKYDVAAGEFMDVVHYYPLDDLSGSAEFYLGEISYHRQDYADAVKSYNAVLEGFSGSPKAPVAQLHKGFSLLQMNKKDAGIHELRLLVQRHPQTPEAAQARTKLTALGVKIAGK
jgi:TolA-binding protein